jgi:hypothetical protein
LPFQETRPQAILESGAGRRLAALGGMRILHDELAARNLRFSSQRLILIAYKSLKLDAGYRVDLIVEDLVVVELKSVSMA